MERAVIAEFENTVEELLKILDAGNIGQITDVVSMYMDIRGYGPVKEAAVADVRLRVSHRVSAMARRNQKRSLSARCATMLSWAKNGINYAFDDKPGMGETMPVAPGIHWLRMPLPFALNHINLWLLEDGDGWIIVDTGLGGDDSKAVWENVFTDTMQGRSVNHIVVTHMHPDHVGCAGWLTDRFDVDLWMTRAEYLLCRVLVADTGRDAPEEGVEFYTAAGFPPEAIERYTKIFGFFGRMVEPLPESFKRLTANFRAPIGDCEWQVIVGRGHSPEHACLFNERLNVLISGDQVLPTISSNVSVYPTEPEANPLQGWLESLAEIKAATTRRRTCTTCTRQAVLRCTCTHRSTYWRPYATARHPIGILSTTAPCDRRIPRVIQVEDQ